MRVCVCVSFSLANTWLPGNLRGRELSAAKAVTVVGCKLCGDRARQECVQNLLSADWTGRRGRGGEEAADQLDQDKVCVGISH